MLTFIIRFAFCSILLFFFVGITAALRRLLGARLSGCMQYDLWLLLFPVFFVPFLPVHPAGAILSSLSHRLLSAESGAFSAAPLSAKSLSGQTSATFSRVKDLAVSADVQKPFWPLLLSFIWIGGMAATAAFLLRSLIRLRQLKRSALPVEDGQLLRIFHLCQASLGIERRIPIYCAPGLKSPVITGLFCPAIFVPARLAHTYTPRQIRYMLLHELKHYRRKDAWMNLLANITRILYWFHPAVRYWLKELSLAREIACDTAVLLLLQKEDYKDYGMTLIRLAEEMSLSPSPLWSGIGGNVGQMQRRIAHIAKFRPQSRSQKTFGYTVLLLAAAFLFFLSPLLSAHSSDDGLADASAGGFPGISPAENLPDISMADDGLPDASLEGDVPGFDKAGKGIAYPELSSCFGKYEGSFVMHDVSDGTWFIYNEEAARTRTSPASTYKIYDALLGLDEGIITPEDSTLSWDGTAYPFPEWETDQNLTSAMENSVNWYFQRIDAQAGNSRVRAFLKKLAYGNQTAGSLMDESVPAQYWMDGTLKISPLEQVRLLERLCSGELPSSPSSIAAVKDAICLQKDVSGSLYGKTGTIRTDGQDVSGWFVGYTEKNGKLYCFAANIQGSKGAAGSKAYEITCSVLAKLLTD